MLFNNKLPELKYLLENTSENNRIGLGEIINDPFGCTPKLLCDHVNYLYRGAFFQPFPKSYKQLVTDVADKVKIDWNPLVHNTKWEYLNASDIEYAVVNHLASNDINIPDKEYLIPPVVKDTIREGLIALITTEDPGRKTIVAAGKPLIGHTINIICDLQNINWKKLMATVIYVHKVIR